MGINKTFLLLMGLNVFTTSAKEFAPRLMEAVLKCRNMSEHMDPMAFGILAQDAIEVEKCPVLLEMLAELSEFEQCMAGGISDVSSLKSAGKNVIWFYLFGGKRPKKLDQAGGVLFDTVRRCHDKHK
jgi:hypothetical protein